MANLFVNKVINASLPLAALVACALISGGCASSVYHLPPPPTAAEQAAAQQEAKRAAADGPSEGELDERARASLLKLYELVKGAQFEEAEQYLSQETRMFLSAAGDVNDASAVLSSGEFKHRDGRVIKFDPVRLLFGGNIVSFRDAPKEADDGETPNRRVLYAVDEEGASHRIIMISEGGEWVLHATSIDPERARVAP